ncbi:MAG: DUF7659 family protein [Bacillota bacterium]
MANMANEYLTLKRKHQEEWNNFPMAFAFNDSQFEVAMSELGLTVTDTDKIYSIGGGGFIRKTDSAALSEMAVRHNKEMKEAIDSDLTGEGFIFDMFDYELANHEYSYTWDVEPTLDALGLTVEEVNANEKLLHGLTKARKQAS